MGLVAVEGGKYMDITGDITLATRLVEEYR